MKIDKKYMDDKARQHILAVFIIVLLVLCVFSSFYGFPVKHAKGAWWNNDWNYYKTLEITDKIDDYQMKILIAYSDSHAGNVSCEGHCQADFDDIRFVYNNATELPYWMENYTASTQATFWINNTGNYSSFEMFYGNDGASTTSSGVDTFYWFDDGEVDGTIANMWTITTTGSGSFAYSTDQNFGNDGTNCIKAVYDGGYGRGDSKPNLSSMSLKNVRVFYRVYTSDGWLSYGLINADPDAAFTYSREPDDDLVYRVVSTWTDSGVNGVDAQWNLIEANLNNDGDSVKWYYNDVLIVADSKRYSFTGADLAFVRLQTWTGTTTLVYFDDVRIALGEGDADKPSWSSFGSEQSSDVWTNSYPVNSNPDPQTGNTSVILTPTLRIQVNDVDMHNQSVNTTWWSNSSDDWVIFATNTSAVNTTFYQSFTNGTVNNMKYWWSVNTSDGNGGWDNDTYSFTTVWGLTTYGDWQALNVTSVDLSGVDPEASDIVNTIAYYNNRTYIVYFTLTSPGHAYITYYNHTSETWHEQYEIASGGDNHFYCSIVINSTGYIHVGYGGHGTLYYRNSTYPENITDWNSAVTITETAYSAYCDLLIDDQDNLYMKYRKGGSPSGDFCFRYKPDNRPWGSEIVVVNDEYIVYPSDFAIDSNGRIHAVWFLYHYPSVAYGYPSYGYTDDNGTTWYKSNDTQYSLPITRLTSDAFNTRWQATDPLWRPFPYIATHENTFNISFSDNMWSNKYWIHHAYNDGSWQNINVTNTSTTDWHHSQCPIVYDSVDNELLIFSVGADNKSVNVSTSSDGVTWETTKVLQLNGANEGIIYFSRKRGYNSNNVDGNRIEVIFKDGDGRLIYLYKLSYPVSPTLSGEAPTNSSTGIGLIPNLYVVCTDNNSDTMTAAWRSNSSGDWVDFAINNTIANNTNITQRNYNFSSASTTYWWSVNLTDGYNWTNETYHFTTSSGCGGVSTIEIGDPLEVYAFEESICLYTVIVEDTYVVFNATGFNITAPSNILITLRHINESTTNAKTNDELLEFEVYLVSGSTTISISGFRENTLHNIYKDDVSDSSFLSNSTGCIEITISSGVSHIYTVYKGGNIAPTISNPSPSDGATGIGFSPTLSVDISDSEGNPMDWYIRTDDSGSWLTLASDTGASNSTIGATTTGSFVNYSSLCNWSVNVSDGETWTNTTFTFTTKDNTAPTISNPSPSDGAPGVSVSLTELSVTIEDNEDTFNWTITTSPDKGSSSANGASNGSKICSISGLSYDGYYLWTVSVTDATSWTNTTYDFTVESDPGSGPPPNSAPTVSNPYPSDEATLIPFTPICHVLVADANLDNIDVNFYWYNETSQWRLMQTNSSVSTGNTVYWNFTNVSSYNTLYNWRVTVYDGIDNITYAYSFTTYPNNPVISTYSPTTGTVDVVQNVTLSITIFDYQGDSMDVTWRSNSGGSWVDFGYNSSVTNGTYTQRFINATESSTLYYWSVNISGSWTNATYSFTTIANIAPVINNPIPRNNKLRVSIHTANVSVVITDANSNFNYTIETNPDIGSISENDVGSGVKTCTVSGLNYSTVYTWYVNATDDESTIRASYTFTTKGSSDFDLTDFKLNLPEWALGPYKVYVGDFIWVFLFIGAIAITWGSSKHISSVFAVILLMFAAYGSTRVFVDNSEISLLFSVIAAICIAAVMLGLFLKKRHG